MNTNEIIELRESIVNRMCNYCECDENSAMNFLRLMLPSFSCEGAMYYEISDNLEKKGY